MKIKTSGVPARLHVMLSIGAALLLSTTTAFGQAAATTTTSGTDVVQLEKFEVTGSRIKRLDTEGPSPITIVTRADIAKSGLVSLTDFVRELPEAAMFTQTNESSTLGAVRGATALDLRGLGMQNTLTIVNGRRVVLTGMAQSSGATFVDFGRFPLAMIERIEILKDGASAVYGSDATAGVVNIITRKDYNGLEVAVSYGNTTQGASVPEKNIALFGGVSSGKLRSTFLVSHATRDRLRASDTKFAGSSDRTQKVLDIVSHSKDEDFRDMIEYYAFAYGLYDLRSGSGPIARVSARDGSALNDAGDKSLSPSFANPWRQGTGGVYNAAAVATFVPQRVGVGVADPNNKYDSLKDTWLLPRTKQTTIMASFNYDFSPHVEGYLDVMYNTKESYIQYAPSPISSAGDNGIFVPASNYWNPFGKDINFNWRLVDGGRPRDALVNYDTYSILAGVKGKILDRYDWDFGYTYGSDKASDKTLGLSERKVREALARTDAKALNIFGGAGFMNDPETLKDLYITTEKAGSADLTLLDLKVTGPIVEVPWFGEIQGAVYAEYREEAFNVRNDSSSSSLDDVIGTVKLADPTDAFRSVKSIAAEVSVPLVKKATIPVFYSLNLSLAARFESYSDGYNSGIKPFAGLRWQLDKNVLVRGSISKSFRAPSLPQLYGGLSQGLLSGLPDYARPMSLTGDSDDGSAIQRLILTGGNPALKPETATSKQVGIVVDVGNYSFLKWVKGLSIEGTYGHIKQTNVIRSLSTTFLRQNEWGDAAGLIVRDPATAGQTFTNTTGNPVNVYTGPGRYNTPGAMTVVPPNGTIVLPGKILKLNTSYLNMGIQQIEYVDFTIKYDKTFPTWGRLLAMTRGTYLLDMDIRSDARNARYNYVSTDWVPRYRVQSYVGWDYKEWNVGVQHNYTAANGSWEDDGWRTSGYSVYAAHVTYKIPAGTVLAGIRVTLNIHNLLNKRPPFAPLETEGYQSGFVARPQGRFVSLGIVKEF